MNRRPAWLVVVFAVVLFCLAPFSLEAEPVRHPHGPLIVRAEGRLEWGLEDKLRIPEFHWPRTLVGYPLHFEKPAQMETLRLRDVVSGEDLAFQLSRVGHSDAVLHFFTDLPSGGSHRWVLETGGSAVRAAQVVQVKQAAEGLELDTGRVKIRLPRSREWKQGETVPGPIVAMDRGHGWMGESRLVSPNRAVLQTETALVEKGPLFVTCKVIYRLEGDAEYAVTFRVIAGYEHVEMFEEARGLPKEDGAYFELAWTGFAPTHRWIAEYGAETEAEAATPIDEPRVTQFRGEDPAFTGPAAVEKAEEELAMRIDITGSNGTSGSKEVAFWDRRTGDALGLFLRDITKWNDHEYAIWTSADTLRPRFRFAAGVLFWRFPVVTGTRDTGVACYRHRDGEPNSVSDSAPPGDARESRNQTLWMQRYVRDPHNQILWMRSRYGGLSLDVVKDWVLTYGGVIRRDGPFGEGGPQLKTVAEWESMMKESAVGRLAKDTVSPVAAGRIRTLVIPNFVRLEPELSMEQRERAVALLLLMAYASAGEDCGPLRSLLSGHPNLMAMGYLYSLLAVPHLFPEHPMAGEWRDRFQKSVELLTLFHTRPEVNQWNARGGRWTENLAGYNWAYLEPILFANELGIASDGVNRCADPSLALLGGYLVGTLTTPLHDVKQAGKRNAQLLPGPLRIHPPMGAHAERRTTSGMMHDLGEMLLRYRPMQAEHLMWAAGPLPGMPLEGGRETPRAGANPGTNPHLKSAKYTGFGVVLRAAVDTPEEISVFLQQIDKGPNYRWGFGGEGGCGDIYYYADGKSYSGHLVEDAGDRRVSDAEFSSNTGVYRDKTFRSIGMNDLTQPLYDLESAQFAEIVPRTGTDAYAWPEYQGRSTMLVGNEYLVVYDAVNSAVSMNHDVRTRFAWNCGKGDEMPLIQHIRGGHDWVTEIGARRSRSAEAAGHRGIWLEGHPHGGDRMTLVTHRADVKYTPSKKSNGPQPDAWALVDTPTSRDYVFQSQKPISVTDGERLFDGRAGVIRQRRDGTVELNLFHGSRICAAGLELRVDDPDLGVSGIFRTNDRVHGVFSSPRGGEFRLSGVGPGRLYLDGKPIQSPYRLPAGEHRWEWTPGLPEPMPPAITKVIHHPWGAHVDFGAVAGAERYRIEVSRDGGKTWLPIGETSGTSQEIRAASGKLHVRVVALNRERTSRPGYEVPVYVTGNVPLSPDGLQVRVETGKARVQWGEVWGASEYRLYRRESGRSAFTEIYRGTLTAYEDAHPAIRARCSTPGAAANAVRLASLGGTAQWLEYAVSAVDGNGEGKKSAVVNTDPSGWLQWVPEGPLRFRRRSAYWLPPYVKAHESPPEHYPE